MKLTAFLIGVGLLASHGAAWIIGWLMGCDWARGHPLDNGDDDKPFRRIP